MTTTEITYLDWEFQAYYEEVEAVDQAQEESTFGSRFLPLSSSFRMTKRK